MRVSWLKNPMTWASHATSAPTKSQTHEAIEATLLLARFLPLQHFLCSLAGDRPEEAETNMVLAGGGGGHQIDGRDGVSGGGDVNWLW